MNVDERCWYTVNERCTWQNLTTLDSSSIEFTDDSRLSLTTVVFDLITEPSLQSARSRATCRAPFARAASPSCTLYLLVQNRCYAHVYVN